MSGNSLTPEQKEDIRQVVENLVNAQYLNNIRCISLVYIDNNDNVKMHHCAAGTDAYVLHTALCIHASQLLNEITNQCARPNKPEDLG